MTSPFDALLNKLRTIKKNLRGSFFQILMVLMALVFISVPILNFFRIASPTPQSTMDVAENLISLGLEAYQQGDLAGAVAYFTRATEFDQEGAYTYYYLGRAYYDGGDLELAHAALSLAFDYRSDIRQRSV